jgi:hypothetical protein
VSSITVGAATGLCRFESVTISAAQPQAVREADRRAVASAAFRNGVNLVVVGIGISSSVAADREEDAAMAQALTASQGRIAKVLDHLKNGTTDEYDQVVTVQPGEFTDPAIAARERELVVDGGYSVF